jgi:hypothetical protein
MVKSMRTSNGLTVPVVRTWVRNAKFGLELA